MMNLVSNFRGFLSGQNSLIQFIRKKKKKNVKCLTQFKNYHNVFSCALTSLIIIFCDNNGSPGVFLTGLRYLFQKSGKFYSTILKKYLFYRFLISFEVLSGFTVMYIYYFPVNTVSIRRLHRICILQNCFRQRILSANTLKSSNYNEKTTRETPDENICIASNATRLCGSDEVIRQVKCLQKNKK